MHKCYYKLCPDTGSFKDGFCEKHWKFVFGGLGNRDRMKLKRIMRNQRNAIERGEPIRQGVKL